MTTIKVNDITNVAGTGAPNFSDGIKYNGAALSTLNTYEYTSSATEPSNPSNGALWWDSTNSLPKIYVNNSWKTVTLEGVDSTPAAYMGDRGLFITGNSRDPINQHNVIDYVDISTAGNATDFGDTSYGTGEYNPGGASNGTRGVFTGGEVNNAQVDTIHYVTITTLGNSVDFGDNSAVSKLVATSSDGTYGLFWNGMNNMGDIEYVTIATTGNATSFGDSTQTWSGGQTGAANGKTRNLGFGSATNGHSYQGNNYGNIIEYVTVQTPSNATDFGDLTGASGYGTSASDNTRAVIAHGWDNSGSSLLYSNVLDYVTIDTTGNATDFGDLTIGRMGLMGTANATRGVFGGGYSSGLTTRNVIDYITIQTTGSAQDFGDLTIARSNGGSLAGNPS